MTKFDAYEAVTERIIAALEAGVVPWRKPWTSVGGNLPLSMSSKKPYRGVNVLLLAVANMEGNYTSPWWGTYAHIAERGGQVRKGEKSTLITFWKQINVTDKETGETKRLPLLRVFRVFNADQADWEEGKKPVTPIRGELVDNDPIDAAEAVVNGYPNPPVIIKRIVDKAYYTPIPDEITVPVIEQYQSVSEYYSTLFHEAIHSSGHKNRLNRPELMTFSHFGDEMYSKEELVAEMGAAFLCAHAGIEAEATLENSAAYIGHWLAQLRNDKKLIVSAAAQAQRAAEHILGVSYAEDNGEAVAA
jgi:antirestriction protein ArdC